MVLSGTMVLSSQKKLKRKREIVDCWCSLQRIDKGFENLGKDIHRYLEHIDADINVLKKVDLPDSMAAELRRGFAVLINQKIDKMVKSYESVVGSAKISEFMQ